MTSHLLHLPSSYPAYLTNNLLTGRSHSCFSHAHSQFPHRKQMEIPANSLSTILQINSKPLYDLTLASVPHFTACLLSLAHYGLKTLTSVVQTQPASSCFRAFGLAVHSAFNNQSLVCLLIIQAPEFKYHLLGEAFPNDLSKVATAPLSRSSK